MSKKNTFYFNHDCNARDDDKIVAVRMKQGAEGYGIYFMLLELLGCSEGCALRRDYNGLAWQLRVPTEAVKRVVEDYGLFQFSEDGKLFHSARLKAQMDAMSETRAKRSQAGKRGMESRWKTPPDNQTLNNGVITNVTTSDNIKEKKENKIKEGERAPARAREDEVEKKNLNNEFMARLRSDQKKIQSIGAACSLTEGDVIRMLDGYAIWLDVGERRKLTYGEYCGTFMTWIQYELKQQSNKNGTNKNGHGGIDIGANRPEDYRAKI